MGAVQISSSSLRLVEVGRVVRFATGPYAGRLAAIVEIIDHKRILVEGPSKSSAVPRHSAALANVSLTPLLVSKLARGSGSAAVKSAWESNDIESKWSQSSQAKSAERQKTRRSLNDFQRYKLMRLQKQNSAAVKIEAAKIRAKA